MRALTMIALMMLSVGFLTHNAVAEPAAAKSDTITMEAAKAKSINRMGLGLFASLRTTRSSTALNASLTSAVQSVGGNADQQLNVERAALTNRTMSSNTYRLAQPQQLQSLAGARFDGLSPTAVPDTARMNKLH